jgi:hypothetical protein
MKHGYSRKHYLESKGIAVADKAECYFCHRERKFKQFRVSDPVPPHDHMDIEVCAKCEKVHIEKRKKAA